MEALVGTYRRGITYIHTSTDHARWTEVAAQGLSDWVRWGIDPVDGLLGLQSRLISNGAGRSRVTANW